MQPRPVFPLDHLPLLADLLDGIKDTDPDTGRYHGKEPRPGAFLGDEHGILQHKGKNQRYDNRKQNDFPVFFINKDPEELPHVNSDLGQPSLPLYILCLHRSPSFPLPGIFLCNDPPALRRLHLCG